MTEDAAELKVAYGRLSISKVTLPFEVSSLRANEREIKFSQQGNQVSFEEMNLTAGQYLQMQRSDMSSK